MSYQNSRKGEDRRLHVRHRVNLSAAISGPKHPRLDCQVRDICKGGMLLDLGEEDRRPQFEPGDHCQIRFDLSDQGGPGPIQARIEVVRRAQSGLGVRILALAEDGEERLTRFIDQIERPVGLGSRAELTRDQSRARAVLREVSQEYLPELLDSLLNTIVDELWAFCERAESDSARSLFTSEIGLLVRSILKERLPQQLRDALIEPLASLGDISPDRDDAKGAPAEEPRELELVEPDAFETWLVKSELSNRLEQASRKTLQTLRVQTSTIFGGVVLPIEPEGFTEILEQSLRSTSIGGAVLRKSLQIAGDYLGNHLGVLYEEVLRAWSAAGLPIFERPPAQQEVRATWPVQEPAGGEQQGLPAAPVPGREAPLRQTSANRRRVPSRGLGLADLLAKLRADDAGLAPASGQALAHQPLKESWCQWFNSIDAQSRDLLQSPQLQERVELTDRMLAHILNDVATPTQLKSVLKRIPIHFLSMAVSQPGALVDEDHPLVELMNRLERLSLFLPNGERDDQPLSREFDELVRRMVSTQAHDMGALGELSGQLQGLDARLGQLYRRNVTHWVDVCETKERQRLAREQVRDRLNAAFGGRQVHRILLELMESGWHSLLESVCQYSGPEGPRWNRHWGSLWSLHRATGGQEDEAEGGERQEISGLIESLLNGLASVGIDPFTSAELLGRIEAVLERVRLGRVPTDGYCAFEELAPKREDAPDLPPPDLPPSEWEQGSAQIDAVPIGALIWMRDKETIRALRLVWRSDDGSRLALTDPLGKRLKTIRRSRLVKALFRGKAQPQVPSRERVMTRAAEASMAEMEERLQDHEHRDPVTGLANQHRLVGSLTSLLVSRPDGSSLYALGFLELDRFDVLTGTYGFGAGEEILAAVARLLREQLPDAPCLAYLGGSRFGLVAQATDREHAGQIGEAVRRGLNQLAFEWEGKACRVSASLGISLSTAEGCAPGHLLSTTGLACLAAQRNGGDRVMLYSEDDEVIRDEIEQMRRWMQTEDAIKAERRRLRCQRIAPIDPAFGSSHHYEILLSVYDDQGQPLPLDSFIASAEALNLMREVDRQVMEATFQWLHACPEEASAVGGVAINLSGQSLSDPDLAASIRANLERWKIPPELVGFEVTETAAISDLDRAVVTLNELKAMGCPLYLDDFGSGLSSYGYLKRLPVDYIKIDGSFIKDILIDPHDQEIVRSFNEIAHFMGKQTIAEYVENPEILDLLREMGVDYAQGYAIEKPRFIDELAAVATNEQPSPEGIQASMNNGVRASG